MYGFVSTVGMGWIGGLALLSAAACGADARIAPAPLPVMPTHWVVALDLSSSVTATDRIAWTESATRRIAPRFAAGDDVRVLGIHEATRTAAPLFVAGVPRAGASSSLQVQVSTYQRLRDVRDGFANAVQAGAGADEHARGTDILGLFDRVGPATPEAVTRLFLWSDMLHVTNDLNLERTPISGHIDAIVARVTTGHRWTNDRFKGAEIVCVLPGRRGAEPVNSRAILKEFWTALFGAVGARLVSFETDLPDQL